MIAPNSESFELKHYLQVRMLSPMNKFRRALTYVLTTKNIEKKPMHFFENILYLRTHWA